MMVQRKHTMVLPAKNKRILILAPTPFFADRGSHMHIAEQTYALGRLGFTTKIVTYHLGRDLPGLDIVRTIKIPWYKKLGPGPSWHKFYVDILLLFTAIRVTRQFKPDIIHAHLHEGCVLGWVLKKMFHLPLVFDMQGSLTGELIAHNFPLVRPQTLRTWWYKLEKIIDHLADALIVQSTEMQQEAQNHFHVPSQRVFIAYDGVSTEQFVPGGADQILLQKLAIPPGKKIIVYLGGLSPHKGVDIVLDAFPRILAKVPNAFLLLMGYPNEEHYQKRVRAMRLEESVRVTGKISYEEAPRYLRLGDIAVAPKRSQTEANGKIYNYMACGLPTVAFDTIVSRDILGDLGIYVRDLNDTTGLAHAIIDLLTNDARRLQLAEKVRRKAVAEYSWDAVAGRIVRAYESARNSKIETRK